MATGSADGVARAGVQVWTEGAVAWSNGNLTLSSSWTHAGGTFDISTATGKDGFVVGDGVFAADGASARLRKLGEAALVVAAEWDVRGEASMEVNAGALVFVVAGNWSAGRVAVAAGARVIFQSGSWHLGAVSGNGTLSMAGGVVTAVVPAMGAGGALELSAGRLSLAGAGATHGSMTVTGGLLSVGAATEIAGVFTHSGGTVVVATGVTLVLSGGGAMSGDLALGGNESIVAFQGGDFSVHAPATVSGTAGSAMAVKGSASVELLVPVAPKLLTVAGDAVLMVNLSGAGASSGLLMSPVSVSGAGRVSVVGNLTLMGALSVTQNASFSLAASAVLVVHDGASFATAGNVHFDENSTLDVLVGDVWVNRSGISSLSRGPSLHSNTLASSSTTSSYTFAGDVVVSGGSLNIEAPILVPGGSWTVIGGTLQLLASAVFNASLIMNPPGGILTVATTHPGVAVSVTVAGFAQTKGFFSVGAGATLAVDPGARTCFITASLLVDPAGNLVLPRSACAQSPTAAPTAMPTQLVSRS